MQANISVVTKPIHVWNAENLLSANANPDQRAMTRRYTISYLALVNLPEVTIRWG